jgi:hypothetical protein
VAFKFTVSVWQRSRPLGNSECDSEAVVSQQRLPTAIHLLHIDQLL